MRSRHLLLCLVTVAGLLACTREASVSTAFEPAAPADTASPIAFKDALD